jgi:asparagine synthase (glutamine-hydrolysing)
MTNQYLERLVDLTEPSANRILNMTPDEARARLQRGPVAGVREIEGSFALVAKDGKVVRMARSLDRPLRYFLAKCTKARRWWWRTALIPSGIG